VGGSHPFHLKHRFARSGASFANRVPDQPLFTNNWVDKNGVTHTDPLDLNCHCYDPNKTFVLNPNAWVDPAKGEFGASAAYYGDYRTQRRPRENMNFGRTFRVKERMEFNLRIEFTNVFNRAYWGDPSGTSLTNAASEAGVFYQRRHQRQYIHRLRTSPHHGRDPVRQRRESVAAAGRDRGTV
jgi:hypothetical protein